MITLLGATGYTGRLVALALDRAGLDYRLAGRSPERLARLAETLPARPGWLVADATQPATLPLLFQESNLLVNCAGPFTDLGEAVVAQAVLNGGHYLDTSNELGYVYRVLAYDTLARRSGAIVVPACGFEVALADCAAAVLAANEAAPLTEVSVAYDLHGRGSSFGSRRSAVRALATSWLSYRDGRWVPALPCRETRRFAWPDGPRPALSFPSGEIVTVPNHLAVRQVTTWLAVSSHARLWAPWLVPAFAWLARGPVGRLVETLITQVLAPPEVGLRSEATFAVQVQTHRGAQVRCLTLAGKGVYDLTAEIVAYAAAQLVQASHDRAGVLPPAAALDAQALLDHAAAHWGVAVHMAEG